MSPIGVKLLIQDRHVKTYSISYLFVCKFYRGRSFILPHFQDGNAFSPCQ